MKNINKYFYKGILFLTLIITSSFREIHLSDPKIAIPDVNFEKALIKACCRLPIFSTV